MGTMAEYPREFAFDVLLRDGEAVRLRPIRPEDAQLEQAFFGRVGRESAYFRFFRAKSSLSPDELRYFTNVDYRDRMAFIAMAAALVAVVVSGSDERDKMGSRGRSGASFASPE